MVAQYISLWIFIIDFLSSLKIFWPVCFPLIVSSSTWHGIMLAHKNSAALKPKSPSAFLHFRSLDIYSCRQSYFRMRGERLSFSRAKNSLVGFSIGINDDDMMIMIRKEDRQDSTQQAYTHIYLIMASLFNSVRDIKTHTYTLAQPSE